MEDNHLEKLLVVFKTLNIYLPYDPKIPLLSIYSREINLCLEKKTCTVVLIVILLIPTIGKSSDIHH